MVIDIILKRSSIKPVGFIVFMMLFFIIIFQSAAQNINEGIYPIQISGDQRFPSWSTDGRYLVFQSNQLGNENIYIYNIKLKSVIQVTHFMTDEEHPVWVPGENALVYDSKRDGIYHLYYFDLNSGKERLLFQRNVQAKEPSYSRSSQLLIFSGLNPLKESWGVYSYDFKFNNLNEVIQKQENVSYPAFSPDGRMVVYQLDNLMHKKIWYLTNWYGKGDKSLQFGNGRPSWDPDSSRLFYAQRKGSVWYIFSVFQDGDGIAREYTAPYPLSSPAVSPDGKYLAFSIETNQGWKIKIIQL